MSSWNCCRLCLAESNLNPINTIGSDAENSWNILLKTTGIKINDGDDLPQEICTECLTFVQTAFIFQEKCQINEAVLKNKLTSLNKSKIKEEIDSEFFNTLFIIEEEKDVENDSQKKNIEENTQNIVIDYKNKCDIALESISNADSTNNLIKKTKVKTKTFSIKKNEMCDEKEISRKRAQERRRERMREDVECEICHKILKSRLSLRKHYKIHTGFDIVCEHCGKKFGSKRMLLGHCKAKHGYEKTDQCSYCDYKGCNPEQVKIHERIHTGERPFVCKDCGQGFHRRSSYLQHVAIHLPEKNVQCDQCPARFKSITLMKIHRNRHKQSKYSFKCYICHSNFARKRNVVRHLQRIHAVVDNCGVIERIKIC